MIKVNYDSETGKVVAFNKDTEPYIEITEQERLQPLPDKYSYYCVDNGKFCIKRRTPTEEELAKDTISNRNKEISELKAKLAQTDYQAIKFAEGWITADDYASMKVDRYLWRKRINELEELINGSSEN